MAFSTDSMQLVHAHPQVKSFLDGRSIASRSDRESKSAAGKTPMRRGILLPTISASAAILVATILVLLWILDIPTPQNVGPI